MSQSTTERNERVREAQGQTAEQFTKEMIQKKLATYSPTVR